MDVTMGNAGPVSELRIYVICFFQMVESNNSSQIYLRASQHCVCQDCGWIPREPQQEGAGSPPRAGGWAGPPREPMLKPEVPVWDVLPPVNEKPPDVDVVGGAADVVAEPNTQPPGAAPWADVLALETALLSVLPPSPKPAGWAGAGAVLPRLSFGVLLPKENPVAPDAGVVVPKLKAGVCVAGVWVLSENRLVAGVLAADWEGVPKLNPPVLDAEKEKPVAGVVVAVFVLPNVNPPVEAPVPPKLNPLMAPDSGGSSYSGSKQIHRYLQPWEDLQSRGSDMIRRHIWKNHLSGLMELSLQGGRPQV